MSGKLRRVDPLPKATAGLRRAMESAGESTRTSGTLTDLSCPSETGVLRSSLSRGTILAVAVVGASVVVFGVPEPIHLNALGARAGIETVVSSWASLSAGLLVVRFRDTRQRDDLWLLTALTSVALTDFVFSALPALIGSDLLGFGSGVQIGCNALVAVAFATAAFIPSGTVAGNGLRSGGVAALGVVAGLANRYRHGAPGHRWRSTDDGTRSGHSAPRAARCGNLLELDPADIRNRVLLSV
jgi:hypothetical protein